MPGRHIKFHALKIEQEALRIVSSFLLDKLVLCCLLFDVVKLQIMDRPSPEFIEVNEIKDILSFLNSVSNRHLVLLMLRRHKELILTITFRLTGDVTNGFF